MGAQSYNTGVIFIKGSARDAYNEAYDDANSENGHQEGYSGDIQTADGYQVITDHPRFGTKAFSDWKKKRLNDMYKGDCVCLELKGAQLKKRKPSYLKGKRGVRGFYFFGMGRC